MIHHGIIGKTRRPCSAKQNHVTKRASEVAPLETPSSYHLINILVSCQYKCIQLRSKEPRLVDFSTLGFVVYEVQHVFYVSSYILSIIPFLHSMRVEPNKRAKVEILIH